jgi:hypothetical protein
MLQLKSSARRNETFTAREDLATLAVSGCMLANV